MWGRDAASRRFAPGATSGEVVATDVSERALRFTRLNALLNGVAAISTRRGSLFEPVAGEQFDRIVSNPPFVITPRGEGVPAYEYRDAGLQGDDLVASFITGVGTHLAPGGVAQLLGNWESRDGRTGLERSRAWVEAAPVALDAWVIERESLDPLSYAELWIRDGGTLPGTPRFAALVDAWLDDFAARGVGRIGFGYVLLRRPADGEPTLARYERISQTLDPRTALGSHCADALAAHDRLAALDDTALAASVLVVAAGRDGSAASPARGGRAECDRAAAGRRVRPHRACRSGPRRARGIVRRRPSGGVADRCDRVAARGRCE